MRTRTWLSCAVAAASLAMATVAFGQAGTPPEPAAARSRLTIAAARHLEYLDPLVAEAIRQHRLPGAVVLAGRPGGTLYLKAFGQRALAPVPEPMTTGTIFDVASLTKVVATTTSVMILLEQGRLGLDDTVTTYIPELGRYGKNRITIRHLLTHLSGLRADFDLALDFEGTDAALRLAVEEVPVAAPGQRFIYSDINFILLGEIVARVSGERLDEFSRTHIFEPLGMRDTTFLPPPELRTRIAPTEACPPHGWPCGGPHAIMLRGTVHDPTARRMGGVAGHAGLFSTAVDLARFCRMVLNGGTLNGVRVLSPLTVALMTRPATPAALGQVRGLGWDIDTRFAANRGALFPIGSFGHTGWTGPSLWMDPVTRSFVVFLANRVHPDGKGDVIALRGRIATIVAAALADAPPPPGSRLLGGDFGPSPTPAPATRPAAPVLTGIDVLKAEQFALVRGKRVGLVTNHTGRSRDGTSTIDVLRAAPGVTLVSLFSPEHGIRGILDAAVPSTRDEATGLPIHSLYGDTRRPTPEMLAGLDTILIDVQDIGARFYTYTTTLAYVMEEAARRGIQVVVLDRPNPIDGFDVEGPIQEDAALGFTGYFPMPVRHGMTIGELARLFNGERRIGAPLVVVPMKNWTRDQWFDATGLEWVNPSPNMRNLNQATLYPGIGAIEYANLSVGRGTETPFEQVGAPWIDGVRLAEMLNARHLPGLRVYPTSFTPASSTYAGARCRGVFLVVTDRDALRPVRVGLELLAAVARMHGAELDTGETWRLFGSREQIEAVKNGADPAAVAASWEAGEARWRNRRAKYLLYGATP
jgi:uncharacterized protein YbbC (DUF1343 family)/CubicO group peptidase (beta-lactamase class C family)